MILLKRLNEEELEDVREFRNLEQPFWRDRDLSELQVKLGGKKDRRGDILTC